MEKWVLALQRFKSDMERICWEVEWLLINGVDFHIPGF